MFLEHEIAKHDVKQRVEIIAECGGHDMIVEHRPDIDQPIDRDQHGGGAQCHHRLARSQHLTELVQPSANRQHRDEQQRAPDDAVCNDFERRDRGQRFEKDRHQAPGDIRAQRLG